MIEVILSLALAAACAVGALFYKRSSEARERALAELNELRSAAHRKQAERSLAIEQAVQERRKATEPLTDTHEDRQKLADMLNEG